ncbi:MAG: hypothetical protein H0X22_09060 [Acidimicrobiia bacterium]|nr:hypothetical protein [Acidimicrobiia bacterium]
MPLLDAVGDGEVIQAYVRFEPLVLDPGRTNLTPERLEEMMAEMTVVDPYRSIMVVEILDEDEDTRNDDGATRRGARRHRSGERALQGRLRRDDLSRSVPRGRLISHRGPRRR